MSKIRKIFDVFINDRPYGVYDIDGKEHAGYNDTPKTWWVYYQNDLPDVEGVTPDIDSDAFVPYCSKSLHRPCWEIIIKEYNSSKEKWNETQFRRSCSVVMKANGKAIYGFTTIDSAWAMSKVQYLQVVLREHCYNFLEPEQEMGRKIWWYGLPATVIPSKHYPGEIGIKPDYEALEKAEWWKQYDLRRKNYNEPNQEDDDIEDEYRAEGEREDFINWGDALSDGHIDWFRK